ncbi:DUF1501 domain-containing protein [Gammaproteobacteria bacterium AH-315-C21]|nr:DUF1501 domain-containing protein [Gammaproteobacteria bacterium AH-315-C21]
MAHFINRRRFLADTSALGFASGMGLLGGLTSAQSFAADTSGYKALVCVFLLGGMDHSDTILPFDLASYNQLATTRAGLFNAYGVDSGTSSRNRENLLPLLPIGDTTPLGGREFALPSQLGPLHTIFDAGDLAIIGSVGPLIQPTTRSQFDARSVPLPARLFSHNDQQSTWQALGTEGAVFGWGGRFLDAARAADPNFNEQFAAVTSGGNSVFLSGENVQPFSVPSGGPRRVNVVNNRSIIGGGNAFNNARSRLFDYFRRSDLGMGNAFARDIAALQSEGLITSNDFADAFANASVTIEFPETSLGRQLNSVANTISIRNTAELAGTNRQIFFVGIGGFDSHSNQANSLPGRHSEIANAISSFREAMIVLGTWNDVTLFTASDFGRTLNDNGDGTDHGWAGHHFVTGGSVQGRRIFGNLPSSDPTSTEYTSSRGRLIPTVSVEQYAGTLGKWFGLNDTELNTALPNITNFNNRDLGFMA